MNKPVLNCSLLWVLGLTAASLMSLSAQTNSPVAVRHVSEEIFPIDLPAVLKLAGAQNLDVQIARERLLEAQAAHQGARLRFFPWLSPGVSYRRHDGRLQDVSGNVFDVSKQSYSLGASLTAQVEPGAAYYEALVARQEAQAASHAVEARRQEAIATAAQLYFELIRAQAATSVVQEALRLASEYLGQVKQAVEAGLALKSNALRVQVQRDRTEVEWLQAQEQQRSVAARLVQNLHLGGTALAGQETELVPLQLVPAEARLDSLVAQALMARPELKQNESLVAAAKAARQGAVFGPWVPSVGAQVFVGGLGGGVGGQTGNFGDTQDYLFGLNWRLGPGGLFDSSRIQGREARLSVANLEVQKAQDEVIRQVVESHNRVHSLSRQMGIHQRSLSAAEEAMNFSRERKRFALGAVLEDIQAQQELTRVRRDYLGAVAAFNQAQYALAYATGSLEAAVAKKE